MRPPLLLPFDTMPTVGAAQEAAHDQGVNAKGKNKGKGNAVPAKGKGFQDKVGPDSDSSSSIVYSGKGGSQNPYSSQNLNLQADKGVVKGNNTGEAGKGKEIKGKHMGKKGKGKRSLRRGQPIEAERELNEWLGRLRESVGELSESVGQAVLLPFDTMPTVGAAQEAAHDQGVNAKGKNKGKGFQDKVGPDSDSSSSIVYSGKGGSQNPYSSQNLNLQADKGVVKGNNTGEAGKGKEIKGKHMGKRGKGKRSRSPPWLMMGRRWA
jgi:hypothetical protein